MLTCGELTEQQSCEAIRPFMDQIEFKQIRYVYPQVKALNQMIECVNTDFFVALDADIILYEDAWQRITDAFGKHRSQENWHTILFPLWDKLTERRILALKVMRTRIFKDNLFLDSPTPDVEHYQRLSSLGYVSVDDYLDDEPMGDHVVKGRFFCYQKYFDVYQTIRKHNNFVWDRGVFLGGESICEKAKFHFDYFYSKYFLTGDQDYLSCISGIYDGITQQLRDKSKDLSGKQMLTHERDAPGLLLKFIEDCKAGLSHIGE
jgi:hypothetical protein